MLKSERTVVLSRLAGGTILKTDESMDELDIFARSLRVITERDYVTFESLLSQIRLSSVCRL